MITIKSNSLIDIEIEFSKMKLMINFPCKISFAAKFQKNYYAKTEPIEFKTK